MRNDPVPIVAVSGFLGSLSLADLHLVSAIALAVGSLGYVVTKWVLLVRATLRADRNRKKE